DEGRSVILRYDIAASLKRCIGWPAPRTMGRPGWTFSRGRAVVREATATDLAALPAWLAQHWQGSKRGALAQSLLEDRVALDSGTVILGEVAGALVDVRVIHPRRDALGWMAILSRLQSEDHTNIAAGVRRWALGVGYDTLSIFVPEAEFRAASY